MNPNIPSLIPTLVLSPIPSLIPTLLPSLIPSTLFTTIPSLIPSLIPTIPTADPHRFPGPALAPDPARFASNPIVEARLVEAQWEGCVQPRAVFIGYNALGDTLCSTAVLRRFRELHPGTLVTYVVQDVEYCRLLEACPEIDTVIYSEVMYIHGLKEFSMEWLMSLAIDHVRDTPLHHFDMARLATLPNLMDVHIAEGLGLTLGMPIENTRPSIMLTEQDQRRTRPFVHRPYVVLSMHSVTNPPREDGREGGVKNWPWERWGELARRIREHHGFDVIALGSERDRRPVMEEIRTLYGLPIRTVAALIQGARNHDQSREWIGPPGSRPGRSAGPLVLEAGSPVMGAAQGPQ